MRPLLLASLLLIPPPAHAVESERLTQFRAPAPSAADAVTEPWPRFLGPHDNLSPDGPQIEQRGLLFHAPQAWTPPALSRGLLFIQQNERDRLTGKRARIQVFDVRGEEKP